jgi:hypothetical protein
VRSDGGVGEVDLLPGEGSARTRRRTRARRAEREWFAACLVLATTRADVNGIVRKHLGARKISFAPMDNAVSLTGMEYGGITTDR